MWKLVKYFLMDQAEEDGAQAGHSWDGKKKKNLTARSGLRAEVLAARFYMIMGGLSLNNIRPLVESPVAGTTEAAMF